MGSPFTSALPFTDAFTVYFYAGSSESAILLKTHTNQENIFIQLGQGATYDSGR